MYSLFYKILDISIRASLVILIVLALRFLLQHGPGKPPKVFSYALWAVVLFRLLCSVSIESNLSVIPTQIQEIAQTRALEESDQISPGQAALAAYHTIGDAINGSLDTIYIELDSDEAGYHGTTWAYHDQVWMLFLGTLWPVGIAAMLIYSTLSLLRLRRRIMGAICVGDNIYLADHIDSPFVMGLIRPKIYLPSNLTAPEQTYILLHEQYHIHRLDHIIKLLSYLARFKKPTLGICIVAGILSVAVLVFCAVNPKLTSGNAVYTTTALYTGGDLLAQSLGLSFQPADGHTYEQIHLSHGFLTVISNENVMLYSGNDMIQSSCSREELMDRLEQEGLYVPTSDTFPGGRLKGNLLEEFVPEYEGFDADICHYFKRDKYDATALSGTNTNTDEYLTDEIAYTIYWFDGIPTWFVEGKSGRFYEMILCVDDYQVTESAVSYEGDSPVYSDTPPDPLYTIYEYISADGTPLRSTTVDQAWGDIDGDGVNEFCYVGRGPTSGLFTFTVGIFENGELAYYSVFCTEHMELSFVTGPDDTLLLQGITQAALPGETPETRIFEISVEEEHVVLTENNDLLTYWATGLKEAATYESR